MSTMNCEHCGQPIRDGEDWYYTADEVALHERCYPRRQFIADDARYDAEFARRRRTRRRAVPAGT